MSILSQIANGTINRRHNNRNATTNIGAITVHENKSRFSLHEKRIILTFVKDYLSTTTSHAEPAVIFILTTHSHIKTVGTFPYLIVRVCHTGDMLRQERSLAGYGTWRLHPDIGSQMQSQTPGPK